MQEVEKEPGLGAMDFVMLGSAASFSYVELCFYLVVFFCFPPGPNHIYFVMIIFISNNIEISLSIVLRFTSIGHCTTYGGYTAGTAIPL